MKKGLTKWFVTAAPLVAAVVLCGCATISENTHAYLGSPQLAPTNPNDVRIYSGEPKVPKDRLGEIILSMDGNPSREKIEKKLREAGAKLGASGVFIASDRTHIHPVVYWDWYGPMTDEYWNRIVVGVAFREK